MDPALTTVTINYFSYFPHSSQHYQSQAILMWQHLQRLAWVHHSGIVLAEKKKVQVCIESSAGLVFGFYLDHGNQHGVRSPDPWSTGLLKQWIALLWEVSSRLQPNDFMT